MHDRAKRIPYEEFAEYYAVLLPYMEWMAEMLLRMPRAGHFESVEQRLSAELVADVREQAADHDVALTLPWFNVETSLDLKQLLAAMGMSAPFLAWLTSVASLRTAASSSPTRSTKRR